MQQCSFQRIIPVDERSLPIGCSRTFRITRGRCVVSRAATAGARRVRGREEAVPPTADNLRGGRAGHRVRQPDGDVPHRHLHRVRRRHPRRRAVRHHCPHLQLLLLRLPVLRARAECARIRPAPLFPLPAAAGDGPLLRAPLLLGRRQFARARAPCEDFGRGMLGRASCDGVQRCPLRTCFSASSCTSPHPGL